MGREEIKTTFRPMRLALDKILTLFQTVIQAEKNYAGVTLTFLLAYIFWHS